MAVRRDICRWQRCVIATSCPEQHLHRDSETTEMVTVPLLPHLWAFQRGRGQLVHSCQGHWCLVHTQKLVAFALGICCLSHSISQHFPSFNKSIRKEWHLFLIRVPGWILLRPPQVCYRGVGGRTSRFGDWLDELTWVSDPSTSVSSPGVIGSTDHPWGELRCS